MLCQAALRGALTPMLCIHHHGCEQLCAALCAAARERRHATAALQAHPTPLLSDSNAEEPTPLQRAADLDGPLAPRAAEVGASGWRMCAAAVAAAAAACLPAATVLGDAPFPRLRWRVFNVWSTCLRGGRRRVRR